MRLVNLDITATPATGTPVRSAPALSPSRETCSGLAVTSSVVELVSGGVGTEDG